MPESLVPVLLVAADWLYRLGFTGFILLRRQRNQASTLAWIVVVLSLPVVGAVLYVLLGEVRLGRKRVRAHAEIAALVKQRSAEAWSTTRYPVLHPDHQPLATLAESVGGTAPRPGNELSIHSNSDDATSHLVADIDAAQHHCHLLFYIYLADGTGRRVAAALQRAAARGIPCRLLVDAVGSRDFLQSSMRRELERSKVAVVDSLPANLLRGAFARLDVRNHRKLAVVDGVVGYTGSQNVADASFAPKPRYAPWVDASIRIRGPAVRDLQELFVEDWYLDTAESLDHLLSIAPPEAPGGIPVQIMGTGPDSRNQALVQLVQAGIHLARADLVLTTPYYVPDEATSSALQTAALRGVRTVLVLPARNDSRLVAAASRSYYRGLLEAGVEIHEYQKGLLHAKTMTVDRDLALVSTANLDRRSFELNFEVSTLVYDSDFASYLRLLQQTYLQGSERLTLATWRERRWPARLWQSAAGTLSPLL